MWHSPCVRLLTCGKSRFASATVLGSNLLVTTETVLVFMQVVCGVVTVVDWALVRVTVHISVISTSAQEKTGTVPVFAY